jgi:DNA-directed RNA polymerase subunit RPC12/RpoP
MMNLACEHCGKEGTLQEHEYSGKRIRLKCPYCSSSFIFKVPANGSAGMTAAATTAPPVTETHAMPLSPPAPAEAPQPAPPEVEKQPEVDEALVHEARRIARLIISEIKLYNQEKIGKARNKREVLDILKHDLIKGKQHYNTRIASKLPMGPDYFMETVKEILLAGKS